MCKGGVEVTRYDKQRIENAIWTLERYRNELRDTQAEIIVDGASITSWDALKVLDLALFMLCKE